MVKHKHKYLLVEVIFGENGGEVSESNIYWALHSQVAYLFGDYGIGCIQSSFQVKVCQTATSITVLRIGVDSCYMITGAIPFVFTVGNSDAVLRLIFQGSSMRSVERQLIKINLESLYAQLREAKTPNERCELQKAIASITGARVAHIKILTSAMEWNGSEMGITLIIDLQDHTGSSHRKTSFKLSSETTVEQLKGEIKSLFIIDKQHQELYFKGKQILSLNSTLEDIGFKDEDTIFLKHANLNTWNALSVQFELAREATEDHEIQILVKENIDFVKILKKNGFFLAYPLLHIELQKFNKDFAHYIDCEEEVMQNAIARYFQLHLKDDGSDPKTRIEYSQKANKGLQKGFKCKITNDEANFGTFYVKIHLGLYPRFPASNHTPDLREIFVYKLLELIKVGPEVHFIPNVHGSTTGLYIATREVSGFNEASDVTINEVNNIQLKLLQNLLFLRDLGSNKSNYGLDQDGQLAIVDFQVENHKGSKQSAIKRLIKTPRSKKVCKEKILVWCLPTNIDKADEAITSTKKFLSRRFNVMDTQQPTYEEYRTKIKSNVEFLNTRFSD